MADELFWEPDVRGVMEQVIARETADGPPDFSDPDLLAVLRDPGPTPPQVPGVSFADATFGETAVRVYRPENPSPRRPAYLMFHGGGLSFGHLNSDHDRCLELTRRCGAVGVNVGYRLAPEHPAGEILGDSYAALAHVVRHADELDVDPRRVALVGSSGGGGLVLALAQLARDRGGPAPMLQVALYPNTDDREPPEHVSRRQAYPVITRENIHQVERNLGLPVPYLPPNRTEDLTGLARAFVLVGQNDPQRDEGVEYAWRLIRAGVVTELHVLPGVPHAFDALAPDSSSARLAVDLVTRALTTAAEAIP